MFIENSVKTRIQVTSISNRSILNDIHCNTYFIFIDYFHFYIMI